MSSLFPDPGTTAQLSRAKLCLRAHQRYPPGPGSKYKMRSKGLRDKARKQRAHNGILPCLELDNSPMASWWAVDYSVGGKGSGVSLVDFIPSFVK